MAGTNGSLLSSFAFYNISRQRIETKLIRINSIAVGLILYVYSRWGTKSLV